MISGLTPLGHGPAQPYYEGEKMRRATLNERLRHEKEQIETRLAKINSILEMLEKNPETGKILDMISELGGF